MLIVITRDENIRDWVTQEKSGSKNWKPIHKLTDGKQKEAEKELTKLLKKIEKDESLCITGHGNDEEIGDKGSGTSDWSWSYKSLAKMLGDNLVSGYQGLILIEACDLHVANFSTKIVCELEKMEKLNGVWIYGYNTGIDIEHVFPNHTHDDLKDLKEIQWAQVKY